jgi:hypothetical protein
MIPNARRVLCAAALALLAPLLFAGAARGADNLLTDPGGGFRATASSATFAGSSCTSATLNGSLNRSTSVSSGTAVGIVTGLSLSGCTFLRSAATVTVLGLPWTIAYDHASVDGNGKVSEIDLTLQNVQVASTIAGLGTCLYSGSIPISVPIGASEAGTIRIGANSLVKSSGGILCPSATSTIGAFEWVVSWFIDIEPRLDIPTIDFRGALGVPKVVTIKNTGLVRTEYLLSIASADPAKFTYDLVVPGAPCDVSLPAMLLAPGASCQIRMTNIGAGGDEWLTIGINSYFYPEFRARMLS